MMKSIYIPFAEERDAYIAECVAHYSTYPAAVGEAEQELERFVDEHPDASPYEVKTRIYELAARCPVKIFRHSPFYHELVAGRTRNWWGFNGLGGWMHALNYDRMTAHLHEQTDPWSEDGICSSHYFDIDHHCVGYDKMLGIGLNGIIADAQERLKSAGGEQAAFLEAVIAGQRAGIVIAQRMGQEAERLAREEPDATIRARLQLIADTAPRVPADPPETFYEALAAMFFYRELTTSLEGLGISILGHLDRLLSPYYEADAAAGRITYEQAKDLMARYLNYTDARWDPAANPEVSTTVIIGGCDAAGDVVANEVTRMIIESFIEHPLRSPKLNARVGREHPDWYLDMLERLALTGKNVLAVFNDEALIPSHTFYGKAIEDARLYVAGGCQEPLLANTECNDRSWGGLCGGNMPKLLLCTIGSTTDVPLIKEQDRILNRAQVDLTTKDAADFESLYAGFMRLVRAVWEHMARHAAQGQALAAEINPCPLVSGGIEDCIETGRDFMAGGARYNATAAIYVGLGTCIDSLYAVRRAVYEDKKVSLQELARHLADDFADAQDLAAYLRNLPKFGHGHEQVDQMAERVSLDLMRAAEGLPHGRNGHTEPSYFAYTDYMGQGAGLGATPDGRRAGEPYSQGSGPSRLRHPASPTDPIRSQEALHLERMPGCGVLDVYLPLSTKAGAISPLIRGFVSKRGSVLQFGVMDKAMLREAQEHPEKHPGLQVRVAGYTATFTMLGRDVQDEIIGRMK